MTDTSPVRGASSTAPLDRSLVVTTPEHVTIEFPLAGLGSRYAALLLDLVVMFVIWMTPVLLLALLGGLGIGGSWATGLLVLWSFLVLWGYSFLYEAFRDGQTPGKRMLAIRTVMDGGYPVTVRAAAIRGLLRIIDIQPGATCLFGGFSMLLSAQHKRLGDHAAGTVVVRELPIEFPDVQETATTDAAAPRFDDRLFTALETFAERQGSLSHAAALKLARPLCEHVEPLMTRGAGESAVEFLVRAHDEESSRRQAARLRVAAGSAAAVALLRSKRERWEAFHDDVRRVRKRGLSSLDEDALSDFAARYREVSADLARARTYGASPRTIYALERITGAAHNLFYRPARHTAGRLGQFIRNGFPALVRRLWKPLLAASLLLYVPGAITYRVVTTQPEYESMLAGVELLQRADRAAADPSMDYFDTIDVPWMGSTTLSSMLIANNVQVSFLAFAAGLAAGLGTVYVLVLNGIHLGAALAVFANRGVLDTIGLFVLPHGVIEMTAITISGAAGLWMGSALYVPGRATRGRALGERARDGVSLVLGVAFLLVVAGLIEGFISPSKIAVPLKLLAAGVAATSLVLYLGVGGRRGDAPETVTDSPAP